MFKGTVATLLALGLTVALTGCGGGTAAGTAGKTTVVHLKSTKFEERRLEVPVGTTVKWVNEDPIDHSVWEGDPEGDKHLFQSKDMGNGKEFSHTFDKAGTYPVYCNTASHHLLGMTMQVVVK